MAAAKAMPVAAMLVPAPEAIVRAVAAPERGTSARGRENHAQTLRGERTPIMGVRWKDAAADALGTNIHRRSPRDPKRSERAADQKISEKKSRIIRYDWFLSFSS